MKNILGLAALSILAASVACSGNNNFNGDDDDNGDSGNTGDDGSTNNDGGTSNDASVPPANAPLVDDLNITNITVLQGVEITIVKNGAVATPNAPIATNRPALVRVFVSPTSGWQPHSVTGLLTLTTGGQQHQFTASLAPQAGGSLDSSMSTTFNFGVDAASIGTDTTYVVQLKDQNSSGNNTGAQYPASGTPTALGAQASGTVKVYVYPIMVSGGSAPATDTTSIATYQAFFQGMYPVTGATLTVQSAITYTGAVPTANGSNWSTMLSWFTKNYRATNAETDVYYYGAFTPTASFASFCGEGCVAGLSNIPSSPSNGAVKASIGLGYGGDANDRQATAQTMTHEVGHGHGREHSPTTTAVQGCSTPSGIDPNYPYTDGELGVLGYDPFAKVEYSTQQYYDIMGYCPWVWISDYTYSALFQWVAADNGADMIAPQGMTTYRWLLVNDDGTITDEGASPVAGIVSGTPYTVKLDDGTSVTGYFTPFDHVGGGQLLVPETHSSYVRVPQLSPSIIKLAH